VLENATAVVTVGGTLLVSIQAIRRPTILPLWSLILQVLITSTVLVVDFAWIYWAYSPRPDACMNVSLSKIDSVYFTLTTLTTVGHGDIAPVTERCRVIVSGQLVLGAILVVIILSLLVVRIVEAGTRRRS
jgi:voltage-gated potassium channel